MDLPPELTIIHQPVRLRIMGLLYKHRDLGFTELRQALDLTDGNLASHGRKLDEVGYIDARKVLTKAGFEVRYAITGDGVRRFRAYLDHLRGLLEDFEVASEDT